MVSLDAGEKFYQREGKSLYSSHMLDLSEEPIEDNLQPVVTILFAWIKWE